MRIFSSVVHAFTNRMNFVYDELSRGRCVSTVNAKIDCSLAKLISSLLLLLENGKLIDPPLARFSARYLVC